jgi:hypothetical protein
LKVGAPSAFSLPRGWAYFQGKRTRNELRIAVVVKTDEKQKEKIRALSSANSCKGFTQQ